MTRFRFLLLLMIACQAQAQTDTVGSCACDKDFAFVVHYLENHYSGFQDNVTDENGLAYQQLKAKLHEKSQQALSETNCLVLLKEYTGFFKDNHLEVRFRAKPVVDEKSEATVQLFKASSVFKSRERVDYDSVQMREYLQQSEDELEGIYENAVYQFAVVRNPTEFRDYYGVITESKTALWEIGQIKCEIKRTSPTSFQTVVFQRNHSVTIGTIDSGDPILAMFSDIKKVFPNSASLSAESNHHLAPAGSWFQFKVLDDSTTYLHIKTFDGSLKRKLDSAMNKVLPIIKQKPNLLLDIRNNGGGSDHNWRILAEYIYTDPFPNDVTEYYCTPEIIKRHEERLAEMQRNISAYGWGVVKYSKIKLKKFKKAPTGTFLPFESTIPWYARRFVVSNKYAQRKVHATPRKIILMYNRNTASAAEGLILNALHSKKVLTFGENSAGAITFGDISTVNTPSGFMLQSATQRTRNRFQYEHTGISPRVKANQNQDWIEQVSLLWQQIR